MRVKPARDEFSWHLTVIYYPPEPIPPPIFFKYIFFSAHVSANLFDCVCLNWIHLCCSTLFHLLIALTEVYSLSVCPQRQPLLDPTHLWLRFSICGFVGGPGPFFFPVWQMVDDPNKPTQGPPPVPGCCWKQQRSPQPALPTVGQLAPQTARTLAPSNFLASQPCFTFFPPLLNTVQL